MIRRLALIGAVLLWPGLARAQGPSVVIKAVDPSAQTLTDVGDSYRNATRVNVVTTTAPPVSAVTLAKAPPAPVQWIGPLGNALGTPGSPVVTAPIDTFGCAGGSRQQTIAVPVNISTATTVRLVLGGAATWTYICAADLVAAGADNVAPIYGMGTTCGTGTVGLSGGTTAATGWNFAANGGLTKGNGQGILWKVPPGNDFCLTTSAAVQLSGSFTVVQF